MKLGLYVIFFMGLACSLCLAEEDEPEYRFDLGLSYRANDQWKVKLSEGFRLHKGQDSLYYHATDVGVVYSGLASWLDLGLNYEEAAKESSSGWTYEHRPYATLTLKHKHGDWDLSDRSRLEYRSLESRRDLWRYRNKLSVRSPWQWTLLALRPYLAEEIYYLFNDQGFYRNKLYGGVTLNLSQTLKGALYYFMQHTDAGREWDLTQVFGFRIKINLDH